MRCRRSRLLTEPVQQVLTDVPEWRVLLEAALTLGALDCLRQQAPVQRIEARQHRVGKPEPVELLEEAKSTATPAQATTTPSPPIAHRSRPLRFTIAMVCPSAVFGSF